VKRLDDWERGFLSAAVDTDGSIYMSNPVASNTFDLRINFSNNDKTLLQKILDILDLDLKISRKKGSKNHVITLSHYVLRWLLPQLTLVVKEWKRKIGISYLDVIDNRDDYETKEQFYADIKLLYNKFYKEL